MEVIVCGFSHSRLPFWPYWFCYRQLVAGGYGGPVTGRHLLLRSGVSCSHLLLAVMAVMPISAWVVDRLLSQSLNMRIPFHAAGSSWGLLPCRLLVWPLLKKGLVCFNTYVNVFFHTIGTKLRRLAGALLNAIKALF
ncbi:hypothetical protein [Agrobacterium pusense]|uniref:hypothetical protein n=1 Tax=Agrobacterium pusense TaxID=648995 RepID=UPI0022B869C1|nr:hypothetical protein [Agrobacterium pusense]MCZ7929500.1 hypothetical protein [Agrobacterium pusense]